jgi:hypothetical protein
LQQIGILPAFKNDDELSSVGRTFLYNPLMLFYTISLGLTGGKKSLGSSVANYIRNNETTKESMLRSISKEEKREREDGRQRN